MFCGLEEEAGVVVRRRLSRGLAAQDFSFRLSSQGLFDNPRECETVIKAPTFYARPLCSDCASLKVIIAKVSIENGDVDGDGVVGGGGNGGV